MEDPASRFWHTAQLFQDKMYIRGGCIGKFEDEEARRVLINTIETFDANDRKWRKVDTKGDPHPGLTAVACASSGKHMYTFGGNDLKCLNAILSKLDLETHTWSQLSPETDEGPMRKDASGMVCIGEGEIAVVCGYVEPRDATKKNGGSSDIYSTFLKRKEVIESANDEGGWTNEIHIFDINRSKYIISE